jgi:GNAT superfamily N-acetyltransferase
VAGDNRPRAGDDHLVIPGEYRLSEDPTRLDLDRIFRWISEEAYWAKGRERPEVERSFANSFPVGVYGPTGQVAVARIVSDQATFAWLCDVFVDSGHRGRGLGTQLARWAVDWAERHGILRIVLATLDAHEVYASAGFTPLAHPQRWMQIDRRPPF